MLNGLENQITEILNTDIDDIISQLNDLLNSDALDSILVHHQFKYKYKSYIIRFICVFKYTKNKG